MFARAPLACGLFLCFSVFGQVEPCKSTPVYSRCEVVFELNDAEAKAHPKPYESIELHAEFRSPEHHKTSLVHAYFDGGRRMVMRFAPDEAGEWTFRLTSNIARFTDKELTFTATASEAAGFIHRANVHHWAAGVNRPHLWLGASVLNLQKLPDDEFRRVIDANAQQKYTHIRALVDGDPSRDLSPFQQLDARVDYITAKGMVCDLILPATPADSDVERYVRYIISRYGAFNITWEVSPQFEDLPNGKETAKRVGQLLKQVDPYGHPRSAGARLTSAPTLGDGWVDRVNYGTTDEQLGAIEHQLYAIPFVNESVRGNSADEFRHQLWNAAMNGQYVTTAAAAPDPKAITSFFTFFNDTRHWELEPYYDVDGGRALALEGVEYVLYVEKPGGPVEVRVEKHGYDVAWFNPIDGEFIRLKNWKGERFAAEPPDTKHDWILYLSREGKKESMLNSWKFESRPILMQEVELSVQKIPFSIDEPAKDDLSLTGPHLYKATLKRQTRGTRWMYYLWTGDVVATGAGFRVLGTGSEGTFQVPPIFGSKLPAVMNLRLAAMNANGKVYALDKIFTLSQ